ncbi:viroplasmin family protein [Methylomonas koyamae]|uniref:ribonuclease H1 domain-containing protein n=1 Tax=Methylomonas koyamae TaxID=702114 RepID=UPI0009EF65A2|nr:viroplasmin family protein [Methylomonas koyamae]
MKKHSLYVVTKGKKTGIFKCWDGDIGARQYVDGFSGSEYRGKLYNLEDAIEWYRDKVGEAPDIHFELEFISIPEHDEGDVYTTYVLIDPRNKKPFYVG